MLLKEKENKEDTVVEEYLWVVTQAEPKYFSSSSIFTLHCLILKLQMFSLMYRCICMYQLFIFVLYIRCICGEIYSFKLHLR